MALPNGSDDTTSDGNHNSTGKRKRRGKKDEVRNNDESHTNRSFNSNNSVIFSASNAESSHQTKQLTVRNNNKNMNDTSKDIIKSGSSNHSKNSNSNNNNNNNNSNNSSNSNNDNNNDNDNKSNHLSKKRRRGNSTKSVSSPSTSVATVAATTVMPSTKSNTTLSDKRNTNTSAIHSNQHYRSNTTAPYDHHSRRKIPLSPAVIEFSTRLKELVRQKNLHLLLQYYYNTNYDHIRDEHHACIVIDACAKGGGGGGSGGVPGDDHDMTNGNSRSNIDIAEAIIAHLQQQQQQPPSSTTSSFSKSITAKQSSLPQKILSSFNVETLTALLKVYVHSGNLYKGWELFHTHIHHPNVRTLNTILRGCLWSAVTITAPPTTMTTSNGISSIDTFTRQESMQPSPPNNMFCGGVITSENAWQHYLTKYNNTKTTPINPVPNEKVIPRQQQSQPQSCFDTSSYEYSIQLLCQSLQVGIATKRIEEYCTIHQIRFKGTAKIIVINNNKSSKNDDNKNVLITSSATIFETLAVIYLALSRAYAILLVLFLPISTATSGSSGEKNDTSNHYGALLWTSCQRCLSAIKLSRTLLLQQHSNVDDDNNNTNNDAVTTTTNSKNKKETTISVAGSGGKRGWKTGQSQQPSTQREYSNAAYRAHRLSELEMEVLSLLKHCKNKNTTNHNTSCHSVPEEDNIYLVTQPLQNKLLYFSGGATTSTTTTLTTNQNSSNNSNVEQRKQSLKKHQIKEKASAVAIKSEVTSTRQQLLIASWYSFGLSQIFAILTKKQNQSLDHNTLCGEDPNEINENYHSYTQLQSTAIMAGKCVIHNDGMINVTAIFGTTDRPLDIEIGAGFGTWIVEQAHRNTDRNYIAMELRADRCYQIYTRAMLQYKEPLPNICVIGCDCNVMLRERISHSTVSTFYAHHPEPPTQVLGDNMKFLQQLSLANNASVVEPVHMLHSTTIRYMCQCLKTGGYIVIVSDNRSYIRLLAATFTKVVREHINLLQTISLDQIKKGIIRSFDDIILQSIRSFETFQSVVEIYAYENPKLTTNPNQSNINDGTSYFDRLWRTGAGTHSETHTRYVIVMQKTGKMSVLQ